MITKEHLEANLAELTRQRDQLVANLHATSGAIEFAKVLIAACDQPANKPEPEQTAE
jgi:predicted nucleic acid-binding Zn ribbon protein